MKPDRVHINGSDWCTLFEERHGPGAYERLLDDLRQPCVTFATIAKRLGVTRERVRQWQMELLPDAPRGHERQRLCATSQRRRQLLQDPLFAAFYRHARARVDASRIELVSAAGGYRRRLVRIDRRVIALRTARPSTSKRPTTSTSAEYRLASYGGAADFVYYRLAAEEYLLIPAQQLHAGEARFVDAPGARYFEFKNTFAALEADAARHAAPAVECAC